MWQKEGVKIYGSELRQAALTALERGEARRVVAEMLGISLPTLPTLDRWRREYRSYGQVAAQARGHRRRSFGPEEQAGLLLLLRQTPDATLEQHLQAWHSTARRRTSRASLARAIARLNWTRKKRV